MTRFGTELAPSPSQPGALSQAGKAKQLEEPPMLGLISAGIATGAFVSGAMLGVGLAGLALTARRCRRRRTEAERW